MQIIATFRDRHLSDYASRLEQLNAGALAETLNLIGARAREKTVAAETQQTNLAGDTIERAQHEIKATPSRLVYTIQSGGGNIRLKYFNARESGAGVVAVPWGSGHYYPGAFINSGWHGARWPSPKLNGHTYKRTGASRLPIKQERSGLYIPTEMTTGQTLAAFEAAVPAGFNIIVRRLGSLLP